MKKKLLSTLLLAGTLLIGSTVSAYAQDVSSDPLQPYEDRLEELSTELGTDLAIVAPEDGTIEDAIDFYSSMSMDEFDSYVKDAYEEAESLDVVTEEYVSEELLVLGRCTFKPALLIIKNIFTTPETPITISMFEHM